MQKYVIILALIFIFSNSLTMLAKSGNASTNITAVLPCFSIVENSSSGANNKDLYVIKTVFQPIKLTNTTRFIIKTNSPEGAQVELTFTSYTNQGNVNALSGEAGRNTGIVAFTRESDCKTNITSVQNITCGYPKKDLNPNAIGYYVEFVNESGDNPIFLTNHGEKALSQALKKPGVTYIDVNLGNPVPNTVSVNDANGLYRTTVTCTLIKP